MTRTGWPTQNGDHRENGSSHKARGLIMGVDSCAMQSSVTSASPARGKDEYMKAKLVVVTRQFCFFLISIAHNEKFTTLSWERGENGDWAHHRITPLFPAYRALSRVSVNGQLMVFMLLKSGMRRWGLCLIPFCIIRCPLITYYTYNLH